MVKDLFNEIDELKKMIQSDFVEISVKQHQIDVIFKKGEPLYLKDLNELYIRMNIGLETKEPYIVSFEDEIHYIIPDIQVSEETQPYIFMKVIQKLAEHICQCPSLEYVVSSFYVKCYLDKPGLYVEDLKKYDEIMGNNGTLELHTQRPYLLYVYYGVNDVDESEGN